MATAAAAQDDGWIPVVQLSSLQATSADCDLASVVVSALQSSGFLVVTSPCFVLLDEVLGVAQQLLTTKNPDEQRRLGIRSHPADPKLDMMLEASELQPGNQQTRLPTDAFDVLSRYSELLGSVLDRLLRLLAVGLGKPEGHFAERHSTRNGSLRLLRYPPVSKTVGNRCKAHSDYGSLTLLLTDSVAGLEVYDDRHSCWRSIPRVPGSLVVNAGSMLSVWTGGVVKATRHRVAGPASTGPWYAGNASGVTKDGANQTADMQPDRQQDQHHAALVKASMLDRFSVAYFADADPCQQIREMGFDAALFGDQEGQIPSTVATVADYNQWRSGQAPPTRAPATTTDKAAYQLGQCSDGVAFLKGEQPRPSAAS